MDDYQLHLEMISRLIEKYRLLKELAGNMQSEVHNLSGENRELREMVTGYQSLTAMTKRKRRRKS